MVNEANIETQKIKGVLTMNKQTNKASATSLMRNAIPTVLKKQYKDGASFDELWNELLKNKDLSKVMINADNKPRYGILQGLTNRIKANKEENITIIKKNDGKNYYIYFNNSIEKLTKLTTNYLEMVNTISLDTLDNIDESKEKTLKEYKTLRNKLANVNQNLQEQL